MKFVIVSCVFAPEPTASARTSTDLAHILASSGHRVKVITAFPNRPAGRLYPGYKQRVWVRERASQGYDILRLLSFFSIESRILSRFFENLSFGIASALAIFFLEKPDVVYANTWPIFAQGLVNLVCKLRGIPFVLSIQDLYPESLIVQKRGFEKTSRLYKLLRWLDTQIAKNCAGLIVISEKFKETYISDRGIPEDKITVIPNWIDDSTSTTVSRCEEIRKNHGIPKDAFLVVYGGNIGVAAGVENLLDAFRHLKQQEDMYLLIAGAGSNLSNCLAWIQRHELERVKIHSPWDASDTYTVLGAADLCVLPTHGEQSLVSVPSKLLTYMMAGRPVLALAVPESETARIIRDSQTGWVISESNAETVRRWIHEISMSPKDELNHRGQAGYDYAMRHFSKRENVSEVINLLKRCGEAA